MALSVSDNYNSWDKFQLYDRNFHLFHLNQYELDSNQYEHVKIKEEEDLHMFRNNINLYDSKITCSKNWEYYKKIVNPYELVYTQKKYNLFPKSICFLKPLSRSYFKMIEMLDLINFFNTKNKSLTTAHVCEGPGGFIEALYSRALLYNKEIKMSIAMTLKPQQSNVPGWRRAFHFLKKNKGIRILYGEDSTGDIMKTQNQQYFIDYVHNELHNSDKKVDIFTADGGFDFSCDYMRQEEMIFPLLLTSTRIGLEVLKKGGVFILKVFDFYHKSTLDLLYLLSCHFEKWTLYKPGMSRPCNPEHYFIGKGFKGCSNETYDVIRLWCSIIENNQPLESLLKMNYLSDFSNIISEIRTKSFTLQTEYLKKVFLIIEENNENIINEYLRRNIKSSYKWCSKFNVPIYENYYLSTEE